MHSSLFQPNNQSDPAFCFIAPFEYMKDVAELSETNVHLVLAHLVDKHPQYAEFYKKLSDQGHRIICDNGAFELGVPYDPERLIELGKKVGAHALVLPDYPFERPEKTVDAATKFIPLFKKAGFATFFVPQSERGDWAGWLRAYDWASRNREVDIIGMSILGIPNALNRVHPASARVVCANILQHTNMFATNKWHHWLGSIDIALELPSLLRLGVVDSTDSSNPVWTALCGHVYNTSGHSFISTAKHRLPEVDFEMAYHRRHLDALTHNIRVVNRICAHPTEFL